VVLFESGPEIYKTLVIRAQKNKMPLVQFPSNQFWQHDIFYIFANRQLFEYALLITSGNKNG